MRPRTHIGPMSPIHGAARRLVLAGRAQRLIANDRTTRRSIEDENENKDEPPTAKPTPTANGHR